MVVCGPIPRHGRPEFFEVATDFAGLPILRDNCGTLLRIADDLFPDCPDCLVGSMRRIGHRGPPPRGSLYRCKRCGHELVAYDPTVWWMKCLAWNPSHVCGRAPALWRRWKR